MNKKIAVLIVFLTGLLVITAIAARLFSGSKIKAGQAVAPAAAVSPAREESPRTGEDAGIDSGGQEYEPPVTGPLLH